MSHVCISNVGSTQRCNVAPKLVESIETSRCLLTHIQGSGLTVRTTGTCVRSRWKGLLDKIRLQNINNVMQDRELYERTKTI